MNALSVLRASAETQLAAGVRAQNAKAAAYWRGWLHALDAVEAAAQAAHGKREAPDDDVSWD